MSSVESRLAELESLLGQRLPENYRDFLLKGDYSVPDCNFYWVVPDEWADNVTKKWADRVDQEPDTHICTIDYMEYIVIGLTGTVGCGKSAVARMIEESGARVIDADLLAHEAVLPGTPALKEIAKTFGKSFIKRDGSLDREKLAAKVFGAKEELDKLNAIVHPRVMQRELELIRQYQEEGVRLIVLDIPLLFETGGQKVADETVVVMVSEEERLRRLQESRGWNHEEIERRMAAQMPQDEKARLAGHVIDNSGSLEETRRQVQDLVARWKSLTQKRKSRRLNNL